MPRHDLQKVIKIGDELFRTRGYYNTGTEEILEQSGLPRSSFYYHFKNKEGFAVRVIEHYGRDSVQFYKAILWNPQVASPKARFQLFFANLMEVTQVKEFKSQCLVQKMSGECAANNELIRTAADEELRKLVAVFAHCIREGQEKGEFRSDQTADDLAKFLHAQLYGAHTMVRLARDTEVMKKTMDMALDYISI